MQNRIIGKIKSIFFVQRTVKLEGSDVLLLLSLILAVTVLIRTYECTIVMFRFNMFSSLYMILCIIYIHRSPHFRSSAQR